MNNELIGVISNEGELEGVIEDDGLSVNVTIAGTGEQGEIGKSAYQEWLDLGNVGSEEDFLSSLKGQDGYTPQKGIDYFDGEKGDKGDQGLQGEKGTDANYVHDQISSAKEWRIIHSLGKYPSVTIVDSGGNVVVGNIKYVSTDEIEISFSFEFSGKAYLN